MKRALVLFLLCACAGLNRRNPLESAEILDRPAPAAATSVKHILLSWSWLEVPYRRMGMTLDPRGQSRNETAADELAAKLLGQCRAGQNFEALMKEYSEDTGSVSAPPMEVTPQTRFVEPFKDLSLRLKPEECGLVRSEFGWHVIKRYR